MEPYRLSTEQVAHRCRVTPRMLQWWDEKMVVPVPRYMGNRVYGAADVFAVMLTAELRGKGISLQRIRKFLKNIAWPHDDRWLVVTPKNAYLRDMPEGVIEELLNSDGAVLVDLSALRKAADAGVRHAA